MILDVRRALATATVSPTPGWFLPGAGHDASLDCQMVVLLGFGDRRMPGLFDPIEVGELRLPNRIFMAPLTRCRADGGRRVPNALMAEYYSQRASAGLILSEATSVTPMGVGYPDTPGIWSDEQVEGWKVVTDSVHQAGGTILLQLWHVGRMSDPIYLDGKLPVAPSAIRPAGHISLVRPVRGFEVPRALDRDEIPGVIAAYRQGAANARRAGFDGVEIHGANGYLLDQFLQSGTNQRTDEYGGSLANRARLMLEVADAVVEVWGPGRVGMHLAPRGDAHDMSDANPRETFLHVARELGQRRLAFLCAREHLGDFASRSRTQTSLRRSLRRQRKVHSGDRRAGHRTRRSRRRRLRRPVHRQPRPPASVPRQSPPQRPRFLHLLRHRAQGLRRLPGTPALSPPPVSIKEGRR